MACCPCLFQGSITWLALLVPILAVFARFSITYSLLLILFSTTLFLFTFSKQKPILVDNSLLKEPPRAQNKLPRQENHQSTPVRENVLVTSPDCSDEDVRKVLSSPDCSDEDVRKVLSSPDCSDEDVRKVLSTRAKTDAVSPKKPRVEDNGQGFLIRSHDLYSELSDQSMDQFSSTSSEDHSSDIEWICNTGQRLDCSDDSISDEESLIEIAIPTGQFVSPEKDPQFNLKCCKLSTEETTLEKDNFLADINEMNEEDNLIEIDIHMGSIKCSSFDI